MSQYKTFNNPKTGFIIRILFLDFGIKSEDIYSTVLHVVHYTVIQQLKLYCLQFSSVVFFVHGEQVQTSVNIFELCWCCSWLTGGLLRLSTLFMNTPIQPACTVAKALYQCILCITFLGPNWGESVSVNISILDHVCSQPYAN